MRRDEISTHRFLILGAARSGIAAARLLRRHGGDVLLADEKEAPSPELAAELKDAGIPAVWGAACAGSLDGRTVMVKSPGIPQTNALVTEARRLGLRVISEIELASAFVSPKARVIAITGTNGKTTTTAWTAHILKSAGLNAVLGGNIGDAWSNSVDAPENQGEGTVFVVEVSSFQLEDLEDFRPSVALLTNLTPDHMDRYDDSFEKYVAAKRNILKNMTGDDELVVNADDAGSRGFADGAKPFVFEFTKEARSGDDEEFLMGALVRAGQIILRTGIVELDEEPSDLQAALVSAAEGLRLIPVSELPLPGAHNLENALAAAVAASLAGADPEGIRQGLRTFRGVEHRIELAGERDGVRFYNDSKATNLDSTEKALLAFTQPIVLIAGGRDAHSNYARLNSLVGERVKHLVTLGEAAPLIEETWGTVVSHERAASMEDAVRRAAAAARPGDVVLLSPACKSFDMYGNFEERGRDFKRWVADVTKD